MAKSTSLIKENKLRSLFLCNNAILCDVVCFDRFYV